MSGISSVEVVSFMDEAFNRGRVSYGGLRYRVGHDLYNNEDFAFMGKNEKLQKLCKELCHWLHLVSREPLDSIRSLFIQHADALGFKLQPYTTPFALSDLDWVSFEELGVELAEAFNLTLIGFNCRSRGSYYISNCGLQMFKNRSNTSEFEEVSGFVP